MKQVKSVQKALLFIAASLVELVITDSIKLNDLDVRAAESRFTERASPVT